MGSRGPKPAPSNVRLLTSARPTVTTTDLADGVHPRVEAPDAPSHLSREARKEWDRIVPELTALGLLARIDRAALALYCQAWGRLQVVERALSSEQNRLADDGKDPSGALVTVTPSGFSREAVLSRLAGDLGQQVDRYLAAFGMSPSSRSRVTVSRNDGQGALPGFDDGSPARFFR
jgi:P27 family predicted phage terminase small subunit